jgi:MFS family permease
MFAGSTLPTPLYSTYQQVFGFSELTLTLVYASYVVGNLGALLFFGRLSDQIGRRPVIAIATALGFASTLVYLFARGTAWLACARVLSGLALGLASGTCAAWIAELIAANIKPLAATFVVGGNMLGLAIGAIVAGLLAQYAPWPLRLSFVVYLGALLVVLAFVWLTPETVRRPIAGIRQLSLRPRIGIPSGIRAKFFAPAITAFDSMALFGFYAALAPTILSKDLHRSSRALGGGVVFELCLVAAVTVIACRSLSSRAAMLIGLAMQLPTVALLVWAQEAKSLTVLLIGTTLAGISAALGYRGSLQVINQIAPAERRAEVVSSYLVAGFAGNSLPVIGVGVLSGILGSLGASIAFSCTIGLFAVAALVIGAKYAPKA